ncbi:EthD family reductase [Persicitalea sp.]|uniref:EthD family reductase n=1 Tax=Persicitalea sp. TaxID=3100273 RepID=UPI00359307C8
MISLTVLYPKTADSQFDADYYFDRHLPLVRERLTSLGLTGIDAEQGLAGAAPDSPPMYAAIARLHFGSVEELQNALAVHGPELIGDIPNFTDAQPLMQVSQIN